MTESKTGQSPMDLFADGRAGEPGGQGGARGQGGPGGSAGSDPAQAVDARQVIRLLHDVADVQMRIISLIDGFWDELRSLSGQCQKASDELQAAVRRWEQVLMQANEGVSQAASGRIPAPQRSSGNKRSGDGRGAAPDPDPAPEPEQNGSPVSNARDSRASGRENRENGRALLGRRRPFRLRLGGQADAARGSTSGAAPPEPPAVAREPAKRPGTPGASEAGGDGAGTLDLADELRYLVVEAQRIFDLLSRK